MRVCLDRSVSAESVALYLHRPLCPRAARPSSGNVTLGLPAATHTNIVQVSPGVSGELRRNVTFVSERREVIDPRRYPLLLLIKRCPPAALKLSRRAFRQHLFTQKKSSLRASVAALEPPPIRLAARVQPEDVAVGHGRRQGAPAPRRTPPGAQLLEEAGQQRRREDSASSPLNTVEAASRFGCSARAWA